MSRIKVGDILTFNKKFNDGGDDYWPHIPAGSHKVVIAAIFFPDNPVYLFYKNIFDLNSPGFTGRGPSPIPTGTCLQCMFEEFNNEPDNCEHKS
jgi:hypothetical protein